MVYRLPVVLLSISLLALLAGDEPAWKAKQVHEWTQEDAQQILNESPWTKTVTASITQASSEGRPGGRHGGYGGGISIPGIAESAAAAVTGIPAAILVVAAIPAAGVIPAVVKEAVMAEAPASRQR